ncbi:hypothetical protein OA58_10930 [Microcystis aeruginosa NIES-88]|nr:hypothetical protein OA58_10930 [Microcystis aeruginosa NIES-88]BCU13831.1 hypothetical protein MAN88_43950 [Microcystis aeruginosa]
MTNNIDHDRLFKELISTFFVEFIELFFPQVMDYLDRDSITFGSSVCVMQWTGVIRDGTLI